MTPTYAHHGNPYTAADLGYGPDDDYEPRNCLYCGLDACDGECSEAKYAADPQARAERAEADARAWAAHLEAQDAEEATMAPAPGRYVFVGERQSPLARRNGWTWQDGRVCAKTLHAALAACGLDPAEQLWFNAYTYEGGRNTAELETARSLWTRGWPVVALGALASRALTERGVPHLPLVHPAARGALRRRERYQAHVKETLLTNGKATDAADATAGSGVG